MVERNSNLLVEGGAGTGKTLTAREAACRFATKGEHVLLLCFTNALAEWLRRTIVDLPSALVTCSPIITRCLVGASSAESGHFSVNAPPGASSELA